MARADTCPLVAGGVELSDAGHRRYRPPLAAQAGCGPSGGPTPAELQGSWELVSKSGKTFKNRFELVIPARHYGFPIGLVRGEIVAQGNEVDLYNEDLCGLAFPKGVGRHRWTLAARAEGVSPFSHQYRIELIERA
jgi:hypothetical protein